MMTKIQIKTPPLHPPFPRLNFTPSFPTLALRGCREEGLGLGGDGNGVLQSVYNSFSLLLLPIPHFPWFLQAVGEIHAPLWTPPWAALWITALATAAPPPSLTSCSQGSSSLFFSSFLTAMQCFS